MVKRFLVLVFALVYSAMVFADFSGQTITVDGGAGTVEMGQ